MTDDEQLARLLRMAIPPTEDIRPGPDLWPRAREHGNVDVAALSWIDVGLAGLIAATLLMAPDWFWLLAYHL